MFQFLRCASSDVFCKSIESNQHWGEVLSCTDASFQRLMDGKVSSSLPAAEPDTEPHKFPAGWGLVACPAAERQSWAPVRVLTTGNWHTSSLGQLERMGNAQCGCCSPARCHSVRSGTSCEQLFVLCTCINVCCLETRLWEFLPK